MIPIRLRRKHDERKGRTGGGERRSWNSGHDGGRALGWIAHFMIGTTLALKYAVVAHLLPGPSALRGALYSLAPFLVAQAMVMPMMEMPIFSGSVPLATG